MFVWKKVKTVIWPWIEMNSEQELHCPFQTKDRRSNVSRVFFTIRSNDYDMTYRFGVKKISKGGSFKSASWSGIEDDIFKHVHALRRNGERFLFTSWLAWRTLDWLECSILIWHSCQEAVSAPISLNLCHFLFPFLPPQKKKRKRKCSHVQVESPESPCWEMYCSSTRFTTGGSWRGSG